MAEEDRNIVDPAARLAGDTQTDRVEAARETLIDSSVVVVDGKTFERFRKLFDGPATPHEKLQKLMNLKVPWES